MKQNEPKHHQNHPCFVSLNLFKWAGGFRVSDTHMR